MGTDQKVVVCYAPEKKCKKPLDKPKLMCYNKSTKGEGKAVPKGKTHESQ